MVRTSRYRAALLLLTLTGCGAAQLSAAPKQMPDDAGERRSSLRELGQRLFEGLRTGSLRESFASAAELEAIIVPEASFRLERDRQISSDSRIRELHFHQDWATATYAGFCAQGAREEPARSSLGLTQRGWVLERILVVARSGASPARSASWLEGDFVYTGHGWKALSLRRIEAPRREHSDLELAPCDVEEGLR